MQVQHGENWNKFSFTKSGVVTKTAVAAASAQHSLADEGADTMKTPGVSTAPSQSSH